MATRDRPQVKDDDLYEALRRKGDSKEKAARIANAAAKEGRHAVAERGGHASGYADWTKADLYQQARKVGIDGRSKMSKQQLIEALRHH